MNYERTAESLDAFKMGGAPRQDCDIIGSYLIGKGGGSAYGGEWRPNPDKPEDNRLIGTPGEIKVTYKKDGTKIETKIGPDGRAVMERHHTTYPNPKYHTDPHDHEISWEFPRYGQPNFIKPHINYWPVDYPDGAPEFKTGRKGFSMQDSQNRFKTISEFKDCIIRGGEPVFSWNGTKYGVCLHEDGYCIADIYGDNEKICTSPDDVLEYIVCGDRLRDVITQVIVVDRTI